MFIYDYASERGYILMDRERCCAICPIPLPSNLAVFCRARARTSKTVRTEFRTRLPGTDVLIFSNRDLRAEAIRIFDRTFAITYALEAVAVFVAVMGIAGALLALVIDRRRELGLLRFLGRFGGQIRKTDSGRSRAARAAGQSRRLRAGIFSFADPGLRHQQAVLRLDHPLPLAGGGAAGRADRGLRGDGHCPDSIPRASRCA